MVKKALLILCIVLMPLMAFAPIANKTQKEIIHFEAERYLFSLKIKNEPFSPELLKEAMFFEKIQSPDIVFIQAQIETGHFSSDLFINANNLFGMRYPKLRETTAIGEYEYHAEYNNWYDSVKDYALFQKWYRSQSYDLTDYLLFLNEMGYATNKNYLCLIKEMS